MLPVPAYNCHVGQGTHRLITWLVGVAVALVLGACASAGDTGTGAAGATAALTYVKCLRSHGVTNFPDPPADGRLPNIPSDIDTTAPAFLSAQRACAKLEPGSTAGPSSSGSRLALLADAQCMRRHGLPNFADPTRSPPPPPPAGVRTGNAVGGPGGYLVLPPTSPAATRAEAACGLRLP